MNKLINCVLVGFFIIFLTCSPRTDQRQLDNKISDLLSARHNWDQAADSLAAFGEAAVPSVLSILTDPEQSDWNKRKAAWTLGKIGSAKPAPQMIKILKDKKTRYAVKLALIEALGQMKAKKAIPSLLELVQSKDIRMRNAVLNALNAAGAAQTRELSLAAIHDNNPYIRATALSVLSNIDQNKGFSIYKNALNDSSMVIQNQAQEILIKLGDTLLDSLISEMASKDVHMRRKLAAIITHIENTKTIPLLITCLQDPDWMVQNRAMVTLCKMDLSPHEQTLTKMLESPSAQVRMNTIWVLGETGQKSAQSALIKALEKPESGWAAATALGKLKSREAVRPLSEMLKIGNLRERRSAAWALHQIGTTEAATLLQTAKQDPDEEVRFYAGNTLP